MPYGPQFDDDCQCCFCCLSSRGIGYMYELRSVVCYTRQVAAPVNFSCTLERFAATISCRQTPLILAWRWHDRHDRQAVTHLVILLKLFPACKRRCDSVHASNRSSAGYCGRFDSVSAKQCALDPVPTWLVKECADVLSPVITSMANVSFLLLFFSVKSEARRH